MKYRKKPVVVEAVQWFKHGDHNKVKHVNPEVNQEKKCENCGQRKGNHGWVNTLEGGHLVCPGDWIITGAAGENYPCKPDIFEKTYEEVED